MTLIEFLSARLDEDEAVARAAIDDARPGSQWMWEQVEETGEDASFWLCTVETFPTASGVGNLPAFPLGYDTTVAEQKPAMAHIARHDPARVVAEVAAKRAVLALHVRRKTGSGSTAEHVCSVCCSEGAGRLDSSMDLWPCNTVTALASVYADHPDFDPTWRT